MVEIQRKEVRIYKQFDRDIIFLYTFIEEVFGAIAAKSFIADIYNPESSGWSLDSIYLLHLECRHLPTNDKFNCGSLTSLWVKKRLQIALPTSPLH